MSDSSLGFAVLRSEDEIEAARAELARRRLVEVWAEAPGPAATRIARRLARRPDPGRVNPDPIKAWDILRAIEAVEASTSSEDRVLDVGSFASAIVPALHRLGRRRLVGIDLDPDVVSMPAANGIDWVVGDLMNTGWDDGEFGAITAISVIEHGVDEAPLFAEVSRLLRPGGIFVFSTDFRPEKLDTSDTRLFGLPWKIHSALEIDEVVAIAAAHGLEPVSPLGPDIRLPGPRPIRFSGLEYTFLYGVLRAVDA